MRILIFLFFIISCGQAVDTSSEKSDRTEATPKPILSSIKEIAAIEKAHAKEAFLKKEAVQFNLNLVFGGKPRISGLITMTTDSRKARLDLENGDQIYVIDADVYHNPDMENTKGVRFDAYTWSYFHLLPYKLSDAGTNWEILDQKPVSDTLYNTQKLSFGEGVGDAPDDWYMVYSDTNTHQIELAAYIVTASKSQAEAEKNPKAIRYTEYKMIDDIPLASHWSFWKWNPTTGITDQVGDAELAELAFVKLNSDFFTPPSNFVKK